MAEIVVLTTATVVVEEHVSFTLSALCQASGAGQELVHGLVGEGLLQPTGQGAAGQGGGPSGDLYLEIQILPHPLFRLDGGDITFDLPVAPWEAALGATVTVPTPDGSVQLSVPPGSSQGRKLRLKGKGLPAKAPGDLYAVLTIALPPSASEPEQEAWRGLARAFAAYNPRAALEA